jgi:hypothetical protein
LAFLLQSNYCRFQHIPTLPVSSRRESGLLEEDARKRVGGVFADGVGSRFAGAHSVR